MTERQFNTDFPEPDEANQVREGRITKSEGFPTSPEARFLAVFAAIGNSEAKQLTLLVLPRSLITPWDLHRRFIELSKGAWKTSKSIQATYCQQTLIPIGLVAEEIFIPLGTHDQVVGFRTTEEGEKYGKPIASYLLSKSEGLPASSLTVFGTTSKSSGQTRSVTTRAGILEYLDTQDANVRSIDVVGELRVSASSVGSHLNHLSKLGLVEYSSIQSEESGWVRYFLEEDVQREQVAQVGSLTTLNREVADIIFEIGHVDAKFIHGKLISNHPDLNERNLTSAISSILSGFTSQGILRREKFKGGEIMSQATITEEGRRIVREIIKPVKRALSGDEELLESWRHIPWQQYAPVAIARYRESSRFANHRSREEWQAEVYSVIRQSPGIRSNEIKTELDYYPARHLRELLKSGRIRKEREGKASRYFVVENTSEN